MSPESIKALMIALAIALAFAAVLLLVAPILNGAA